jgi:aspartyl-tRNA(Asn)/glutamyl-tRNA(Gln) amidotransferase subunit A
MRDTWSAAEIARRVRAGDVSASEICEDALRRVHAIDPRLHAFLSIGDEEARGRARAIDATRDPSTLGPLAGVPIAIKDNICTRRSRTTAGSAILERFRAPYDATVVTRLERAGAIPIGKTNCDEFAMGSSTENSAFGPTVNPWAADRTPGGSSGGSAAAVAARIVPAALGSDTGGSIRQPAALCGITGLRPTYGRVSRYGLIAFASSLDQIGPMTMTAEDAALVLEAIAGADPSDATTSAEPVARYAAALSGDLRGTRIGVPRDVVAGELDAAVLRRFDESLSACAARGAIVTDITLPHNGHATAVYYLVATAEASSNLARYDGVRYGFRAPLGADANLTAMYETTRAHGFGDEVKRRIILGTYVLSEGYYDQYYVKAQQVRRLIRGDYDEAFARVDVVALPTSPTPAFALGERVADPLRMYLSDVLTVGPSLAGLPSISIPCGFADQKLPVGLQLVGRAFDEVTLLRVADAYQRETTWHLAQPPVTAG